MKTVPFKKPPSLQEPIANLLDIMTPQNKNSVATSQGTLSQKSNNTNATSPELFSQRSNTSPSKHTNPERELSFETPKRRSQRNSQPLPIFDVAQLQQEEKKRRKEKTGGIPRNTQALAPLSAFQFSVVYSICIYAFRGS